MTTKLLKAISGLALMAGSTQVFAAGACCVAGAVCCVLGMPCCL